jgi:hypothetical protein
MEIVGDTSALNAGVKEKNTKTNKITIVKNQKLATQNFLFNMYINFPFCKSAGVVKNRLYDHGYGTVITFVTHSQCKSAGVVKNRIYDHGYGTVITFVTHSQCKSAGVVKNRIYDHGYGTVSKHENKQNYNC